MYSCYGPAMLFLLACHHPDPQRHAPEPEPERWTVFVYMNGDNDLEEYVVHDLNELEAGGSSAYVDVIVQADRIEGYDDRDGDWTGTRRYRIEADADLETVTSPVIEELGELDMGDPAVLADFLAWGDAEYPADHRVLALWDHGDGWTIAPSEAVSWDDTDGNDLSIAEGELAAGLEAADPFDIVAFDACNMANWEVGHALAPYADFMVASEATVGGEGLQYTPLLTLLRDAPATDARTLADAMARDAAVTGEEWTFSAIDLSRMDALAEAIDALAGAALGDGALRDALLADRDASRGADADWHDYYLDLGSFAAVVAADENQPALAGPAAEVARALAASVVGEYGNDPYKWAGGLTIFFDLSDPWYVDLYHEGAGATWADATRWDELMVEMAR